MSTRRAAVAGMFYPDDRRRLAKQIQGFLEEADQPELDIDLKALIVPHAGYIYSGPTAGFAYRLLSSRRFARILMLGPSHYVSFSGLALPGVDTLEMPFGAVAVDAAGAAELLVNPLVHNSIEAHAREHSLEVQLPFLQVVAPGVPVVPVLTGSVEPSLVAEAIDLLVDDTTLLLVSSDLSHYESAPAARLIDATTAAAIEALDGDELGPESACGRTAIQAALNLAKRRGYTVRTLDLRNSADTAGTPDRVVGYGAFAIGIG